MIVGMHLQLLLSQRTKNFVVKTLVEQTGYAHYSATKDILHNEAPAGTLLLVTISITDISATQQLRAILIQ